MGDLRFSSMKFLPPVPGGARLRLFTACILSPLLRTRDCALGLVREVLLVRVREKRSFSLAGGVCTFEREEEGGVVVLRRRRRKGGLGVDAPPIAGRGDDDDGGLHERDEGGGVRKEDRGGDRRRGSVEVLQGKEGGKCEIEEIATLEGGWSETKEGVSSVVEEEDPKLSREETVVRVSDRLMVCLPCERAWGAKANGS